METRKRIVAACLALLLAIWASGCGAGESGIVVERADRNGAGGEAERVVRLYNFKVEMAEQLDTLLSAYKLESGVTFEVDTCGGGCDYSAGLKTRFNSGDRPDIFFVAGHTDLELWEEHLEDLSDQPWVGDIVELAKPAITLDGKVYGMPLALEGWGFIYNKALFRQAGVAEPPKTLSQLREAARKLRAAGIQPFENGYAEWWILGNHLANAAFAYHPDPVRFVEDLRNGRAKFADDETMGQWLDLVDLTVEYGQDNALQTDYNTQVTNFALGRAAMMQQGVWTQLQIDELAPDLPIGILPMPINDDAEAMDRLPVGVANYWVVSKQSKVKDEAKAFLQWLVTSEAGKAFIAKEAKFIPAFRSIPADPEDLGPLAATVMDYAERGKTLSWMWQRFPGYEANTSQMAVQLQAYIGKQIPEDRLFLEWQRIWDELSRQ